MCEVVGFAPVNRIQIVRMLLNPLRVVSDQAIVIAFVQVAPFNVAANRFMQPTVGVDQPDQTEHYC